MATESPTTKRRYEKKARAAQEDETRRRIIEAAIGLHGTVGPAVRRRAAPVLLRSDAG